MESAWIGLIGVAVGAAIPIGYNIYRDHRDTKEKYKAMLYEKRLEIYQEAFHLIFKYLESTPESINELKKDRMDEILAAHKKIINFWTLHCLYLDPESLKAITSLIEKMKTVYDISNCLLKNLPTQEDAAKYNEWHAECQELVTQTTIALEKGIGMKHIEQLKRLHTV